MTVLVSACLLGRMCRYDGGTNLSPVVVAEIQRLRDTGVEVVEVCPEELGGLPTPRLPAELVGGGGAEVLLGQAQVLVVATRRNVTGAFIGGAKAARDLAPTATRAILKARSPSCGVDKTYICGVLAPGDGVFAALLRSQGVSLSTEEAPVSPNPATADTAKG
jgi:uncharacterized protein YbbK (DUF523 family)